MKISFEITPGCRKSFEYIYVYINFQRLSAEKRKYSSVDGDITASSRSRGNEGTKERRTIASVFGEAGGKKAEFRSGGSGACQSCLGSRVSLAPCSNISSSAFLSSERG